MQLLQAVGLRQQLSAALVAILQISPCLQASEVVLDFLEPISNDSALYKQLVRTAAESIFSSSSLLCAQTDESMLHLSDLLLADVHLRAAYFDIYAAAVVQRDSNYGLLKQLMQSPAVQAAAAMPEISG